MTFKSLARSFAGGEITPELYGRLDLGKYQTGLAKCRNYVPLPHGPVTRRRGTTFVAETEGSGGAYFEDGEARLIPFAFSADQTIVLCFTDLVIRFYTQGGVLQYDQVGAPAWTATTYAIGDIVAHSGAWYQAKSATIGTDVPGVSSKWFELPVDGTYEIATAYFFNTAKQLKYAQSADTLTLVAEGYVPMELRRFGPTDWRLASINFAPKLDAPTSVSSTATGVGANPTNHTYAVTAVASDGIEESLESAQTTVSNNLNNAGAYNTISWAAVTGAELYNVYKMQGGVLCYSGQSRTTSFIDDNIKPDPLKTPPSAFIPLGTGDDAPSVVTYYEQRRWFAATEASPQTVYATRTGSESNMTSSIPSQSDDAMEFRIAALQQNKIRHLVPLSDLIAFTAGGEWRIFNSGGESVTPTTVAVKPQGYSGASNTIPVMTASSILFVQALGARLRELSFSNDSQSYKSIDLSVMAPHLVDGFQITDMAFSRAPVPTVWCVRNDGILLSLTYLPEHQVYAWAWHDFQDGKVESVCTVTENFADVVYLSILRMTHDGKYRRCIERMMPLGVLPHSHSGAPSEEDYYVDCGFTYENNTAFTVVSGLGHLEGREVQLKADGAIVTPKTVVSGQITLDEPAKHVVVGLGYKSDIVTLPLGIEGAEAYGQAMKKNVARVYLRVRETNNVRIGPSFDHMTSPRVRDVLDPYNKPPALKNGEISVALPGQWTDDAAVYVRQEEPVAGTILSMVLEVAPGA